MQPQHEPPLVDFSVMPRRMLSVAGVVGGLALIGCVVDGALNGLTFALMGRWVGVFVVGVVVGTAVMTAVHAVGGADRAGRNGQRLASPDVGLSPRRLSAVKPGDEADEADEADDTEAGGADEAGPAPTRDRVPPADPSP
ncbi:MAG TPA: hypothetical protein VMM13_02970 [Euzebya sp.]|nr:hypothetical protein [Euzebya sp.]